MLVVVYHSLGSHINWPSSLILEVEDFFFPLSYLSWYFIFIWRIIALQYRVGFCYTTTWISHTYTYTLSLLSFAPDPSHPPTHLIPVIWVVTEHQTGPWQLPTHSLFSHDNVYVSVLLSQFIRPSPCLSVYKFILYVLR